MSLDSLLKPVDESMTREFDWSELVGLSGDERHGIHDHLRHWLLLWLFCNGAWDVLPVEPETSKAGGER